MYYRVAIQLDTTAPWQWKSTVLSSLQYLFHFLRLFRGLPLDQLRVFSCSTREGLQEQLEQENQGGGSPSVTAAHFLQARLIEFPHESGAMPQREARAWQQMAAIAVAAHPDVSESRRYVNDLVARSMSSLERRRLELELGPGGDHDVPYRLVLPASMLQALAWMRLLARFQRGDLQA
ncbi:MAG TPA: hypothetical protein VFA09_02720 [Ktedonobacteraceae bacterium]|nr:hypothetical protein [Ktedonobacteraceae bacterium]